MCHNSFWNGCKLPRHTHSSTSRAPDDIDSYIQETGHAGRDGLQSEAILLKKKLIPDISVII